MRVLSKGQIVGAKWLANAGRVLLLGDRMGYGKTATFIRACDFVRARRILVLCPPAVTLNVLDEWARWSIHAPALTRLETEKDDVPSEGVVSCSYALAARPKMSKKLLAAEWDVVICDEAHALKTPDAARTKVALGYRGHGGLIRRTKRLWFVTATPIQLHAGEWFSFAAACGAWDSTHARFIDRWCVTQQTPFGQKIVGSRDVDDLKARLAPYVLARQALEDTRPPLTVDSVRVIGRPLNLATIDPETIRAIEMASIAGDWSHLEGPAVATVRRMIGTAKADAIADYAASELSSGAHKLLIFVIHRDVVNIISELMSRHKIPHGGINGETSPKDRESHVAEFQRPGSPMRALICNIRSAGEGLTLTAADRVLIGEADWNPRVNDQAIARAWRRGQSRPVRASFLSLAGSFDDRVAAVLARRANDVASAEIVS